MVLAAAMALSADDVKEITTPTPELKSLYEDANSTCRGSYPQDAKMYAGCAAREIYYEVLKARNVCLDGPSGAEMTWQPCYDKRTGHRVSE